jgi:hypothetical protein
MVVEQYVQWHTDFVRVALRVDVLDAAGLQLEWDGNLRRVDYALLPAQSDGVHVGAGVLDPSVIANGRPLPGGIPASAAMPPG